jgi:hypothetical protein
MKSFVLIIVIYFTFSSCIKDKPPVEVRPELPSSNTQKIYVINEGGYGYNQASVSLYDPTTKQVIDDYYKLQNNEALGDIAQSISLINRSFYIVVNNSNRIVVCSSDFKKIAEIKNLGSPRYVVQVSSSKAYVSDLSSNSINIIDLNSNKNIGSIPCSGWTEKMVVVANKAFVTNLRKKNIYVINTVNDLVADSIDLVAKSGNIILDKNEKLWVISGGDSLPAKLQRINPNTHTIELSLTFNTGTNPGNLCTNKTRDTLYFLNNGIFRFPISSATLPQTALVSGNNRVYYGLGVNPRDYTIYAADALDYVQRSNIYIFDNNGNQLSFFKAGIISNGFYFE